MAHRFEEYVRPQTVDEATRLLAAPDARALAGGTALLAHRPASARVVVDLQDLPLDFVRQDADGLHLGALTTFETLTGDPMVRAIGGGLVAHCARFSAAFTERQAATVGGTLAAAGWNDLLLAFMATDGWARVAWSGGEEVIPVDDLVRDRQAWLELGTLITEVLIPIQPESARYGYKRISRTPRDRAIVAGAVGIGRDDGGCVTGARVAVGGASATAMRLAGAETELNGRALNLNEIAQVAETARRAVEPAGDWLASAEYRREMTAIAVRRALERAIT